MKIRCIIVDDEPLAIKVLKGYIDQIEGVDVKQTFANAIDALNFLKTEHVDVIFLDINMPVLDGLSFIKSLESPPLLIITSAYSEFAIQSYELEVLDYLVKPIEFPRFMKALNKVNKHLEILHSTEHKVSKDRPYIFVKIDKKRMKKIFLDEILIIESLKDYLKIKTISGNYIVHHTLSNFTELLPSAHFIRIHRSYTVALNKIDALEGNSVEIEGLRYVIGRSYLDEVKQRILESSI